MKNSLFKEKKEQTVTKHSILANYLQPWAKIISTYFTRAYYVDAFAGRGEYESGEEGSPVIAANILRRWQKHPSQFYCICIEKNSERYKSLVTSLQDFRNIIGVETYNDEFLRVIEDILAKIGRHPGFFLIDPEGFSGMDFNKIESILTQPHKEILINFQYNAIQRWIETARNLTSKDDSKRENALQLSETFNKLFGTERWKEIAVKHISSTTKESELVNLYASQIRNKGFFEWHFRNKFPKKNRTYYYLVYATKNLNAFKIMKEVMYKEESKKNFQMNLMGELDFRTFQKNLCEKYKAGESTEYNEILSYVLQHTQYLEKDLKKALVSLKIPEVPNPADSKNPFYNFSEIGFYKNMSNNPILHDSASIQVSETKKLALELPAIKLSKKVRIFLQQYTAVDNTNGLLVKQVGDGSIIKRFDKTPLPTKSTSVICPHFLELKWAYGCPFDCAWCYLKGTFRFLPTRTKPVVKDYEKIELHTRRFLEEVATPEILNTGEIADSLMGEGLSDPFSKFIIPMFEEQDRHKVLFVTKSDNIKQLLEINPHNQVIISFSLNADEIAKRWERGAPSVDRRVDAGRKLSQAGYEVRVRIDPVVPVEGWETRYTALIDQIFANFTPERITLGSLRGLQSTINGSTDRSWLQYLNENSNWGKKVDFKTRYEIYATIINQLKESYNYSDVAFCKETVAMWGRLGMEYKKIKCNCIW